MGNSDSNSKQNEQNVWSETICLPATRFPMRAELAKREPEILNFWKENRVFQKLIESRKSAPVFFLHDGPPYANGNFHVGHSLNKTLKDIINKFHILQGKYVPYIPGWDCHGLPIELAVLKKLANKKNGSDKDPIQIRKACREYASEFIRIQAKDQTRFGIFWDDSDVDSLSAENPIESDHFYYTMSPAYEASILRAFAELYSKGLIYKGKRPVSWDIDTATAHAEAEIEYAEHESPSVYVAFPVKNLINTFVVIWTTTPWTLPANLGVCFNREIEYQKYSTEHGNLILAKGLAEAFFTATGIASVPGTPCTIEEIEALQVMHPFIERESRVLFGDHVTLEAGTGIVHTAPGHGQDDYAVGLKYSLEPYSPVDHRGRYTQEFPEMQGVKIWDANPKIIELLKKKNLLLGQQTIRHSYPHSWRSHKPLIVRATPQWFLKIDPLRDDALKAAAETNWIPAWGENRFKGMIANRPDWCLSRQRHWGVPIPAFTCTNCNHTHINQTTLDYIIEKVSQEGIEIWFDKPVEELLPQETKCEQCGSTTFEKETDILDVWFDSGVSWYAMQQKHPELQFPADLYLEGSDQHRGWFQTSLWPSIALTGKAPFRNVLTHGYVLDDKGRAMSKSLGNVLSPVDDVIPVYGADILRLWVSSEDYRTDNRIGKEMLTQLADAYRKIRNTFRYLSGNLADGSLATETNIDDITEDIDRWVLARASELEGSVKKAYENYEFHTVYQRTLQFCTVTLSNQYFEIIRDRLYCDEKPNGVSPFSERRKSALATLQILQDTLSLILAPILSFTCEEVNRLNNETSIFLKTWPDLTKFASPDLIQKFEPVWELKDSIYRHIEEARQKGINGEKPGSSTELSAAISTQDLPEFSTENLAQYFVVSAVERSNDLTTRQTTIFKAKGRKCARCWLYRDLNDQELCKRCEQVVQ